MIIAPVQSLCEARSRLAARMLPQAARILPMCALVLAHIAASAQVAPGGIDRPRPLERPDLPGPRTPGPVITLPPGTLSPAPAQDSVPQGSGSATPALREDSASPQIEVSRFELSGNTLFSTETLRADVLSRYEGRRLSLEALEAARRELTQYYIDRQYINSGALIPDQDVSEGVVRLRIIEGRLADIRVSGTTRLDPEYVRGRIALAASGPLNLAALHDRLSVLRQDAQIAAIHAELRPGLRPGEAILLVRVEESDPLRAALVFGNNRSPSVGEYRGELQVAHANVTGAGDQLSVRAGRTRGLADVALAYQRPLDSADTTLLLRAERSSSVVVESPFAEVDIRSRITTYGIGLSRPLWRTPNDQVLLAVMLERRDSLTSLLGEPFSFAPGVQNGVAKVTALRLNQDWMRRGTESVIAARSSFALGLPAWGATRNEQAPDGRFVSWLGQAQWLRRMANDWQAIVRTDMQFASHALLPSEKIAIGGASSVRGYRENQIVRDNGIVVSGELRIPIGGSAVAGNSSADGRITGLEFVPFIDSGWAWNKSLSADRLTSAGLGLRWRASRTLSAEIYKGFALRKIDQPGNAVQDHGVHFLIAYQPRAL